jgi:hypothetical protein
MKLRNRTAVWGFLAAALAVSFVLSAWPGAGVSGESNGIHVAEAGTRQDEYNTTISVNGYVFNITEGEPELPPDLVAQPPESGEIGLYIIHFSSMISQEIDDAIEALNITIAGSLPFHAYKAHMTPEQSQLAENLSFVDWVGLYHPAYKISRDLDPDQLKLEAWLFGQKIPYEAILDVRSKFLSIEWEGYLIGDGVRDEYLFKGTLSSSEAKIEIARNPYVHYIYPIPVSQWMDENEDDNRYLIPAIVIIAIFSTAVTIAFIRSKRRKEANR